MITYWQTLGQYTMLAAAFSPFLSAFNASGAPAGLFNTYKTPASVSASAQTMPLPRASQGITYKDTPLAPQVHDDALVPALVGEDEEEMPISTQISVYVVREGDTLSGIANMYDVSPATIANYNDLRIGAPLTPGKTLLILPVSGIRYVVKKGDTIEAIAKKYSAKASEIAEFNQISSASLIAGTEIIIPNAELHVDPVPGTKPIVRPSLPNIAGYFIRPTTGPRTQGLHGQNAIDFGGVLGSPVVAAASGKVLIARSGGYNGGYGSYVVIKHDNGTQTLYAHLSSVNVSDGQVVAQGQKIGGMGNTGKVYGPTGIHLHFQVDGARNPF